MFWNTRWMRMKHDNNHPHPKCFVYSVKIQTFQLDFFFVEVVCLSPGLLPFHEIRLWWPGAKKSWPQEDLRGFAAHILPKFAANNSIQIRGKTEEIFLYHLSWWPEAFRSSFITFTSEWELKHIAQWARPDFTFFAFIILNAIVHQTPTCGCNTKRCCCPTVHL